MMCDRLEMSIIKVRIMGVVFKYIDSDLIMIINSSDTHVKLCHGSNKVTMYMNLQ